MDSDKIESCDEQNRSGRDVVNGISAFRGGDAEHSQQIFGEDCCNRAERRRTNDRQFRPAEKKSRHPAEPLAQVNENSSRLRKRTCQFGICQRSCEHTYAANNPRCKEQSLVGDSRGDPGRRPENAAADRRTHDYRDCAEQT